MKVRTDCFIVFAAGVSCVMIWAWYMVMRAVITERIMAIT